MANKHKDLIAGNQRWVRQMLEQDPDYFDKLSKGQSPEYLWIGCSDSRVPANEITGTQPGDIFVHRNIANVVVHTDMNLLSVVQYAVEVLKVKHVIVCGHYGCGGVKTAMGNQEFGLIDNWLRHIKDVYRFHQDELDAIEDPAVRERRLVELNIEEQVLNLAKTSIIQNAWSQGDMPYLHGWVYDIHDGLLKDLEVSVREPEKFDKIYQFSKAAEISSLESYITKARPISAR